MQINLPLYSRSEIERYLKKEGSALKHPERQAALARQLLEAVEGALDVADLDEDLRSAFNKKPGLILRPTNADADFYGSQAPAAFHQAQSLVQGITLDPTHVAGVDQASFHIGYSGDTLVALINATSHTLESVLQNPELLTPTLLIVGAGAYATRMLKPRRFTIFGGRRLAHA